MCLVDCVVVVFCLLLIQIIVRCCLVFLQDFWHLLAMQLLGALVIIAAGASMTVVYGLLYVIPIQPFTYILVR